jgi:hypothetical protein
VGDDDDDDDDDAGGDNVVGRRSKLTQCTTGRHEQ